MHTVLTACYNRRFLAFLCPLVQESPKDSQDTADGGYFDLSFHHHVTVLNDSSSSVAKMRRCVVLAS